MVINVVNIVAINLSQSFCRIYRSDEPPALSYDLIISSKCKTFHSVQHVPSVENLHSYHIRHVTLLLRIYVFKFLRAVHYYTQKNAWVITITQVLCITFSPRYFPARIFTRATAAIAPLCWSCNKPITSHSCVLKPAGTSTDWLPVFAPFRLHATNFRTICT